jgi:hypothetical protein
MANCPNCGHDLTGSSVPFCVSCGQPLPGADTVTAQRPAPAYDPGSPYGAPRAQDPYAAPRAQDPYAASGGLDPYADLYAVPAGQNPYAGPGQSPYGATRAQDPYTPAYSSPPAYGSPPPDSLPGRRGGHQKSRSPRRALVIALVAMVVLAGGGAGAYLLSHHKASGVATASQTQGASASAPPSPAAPQSSSPQSSSSQQAPPPATSEKEQVTRFQSAVRGSAKARALVTTAVPQVASCATPPATGIAQLQKAITDRQRVTATLSGLPVSQIPNGEAMRADLGKVLQLSVTADHDFISWMKNPATVATCPGSTATDANYAAGVQASQQAVQAKEQFLALWNPLAKKFVLPTYTTLDI